MLLGSFQDFDARVLAGPTAAEYEPVPLVREAPPRIPWARGVAEMAEAILEGRPHRASAEQAAHVVEILDGARQSIREDGRPIAIESAFAPPPPLPWAADAD